MVRDAGLKVVFIPLPVQTIFNDKLAVFMSF
jgi:hypothetical protein